VICVAVRSPRGEAEVVRSECSTEGVRQLRKLVRDTPVGKPEPLNTRGATPQAFEGKLCLRCPDRRQIVALSTSPDVRRLTISDRDHKRVDADTVHVLEQAACAEHLVIRMRCHDDQAAWARRTQRREPRNVSRLEPGSFVGPRVHIVND
jgi:hypothetical protein